MSADLLRRNIFELRPLEIRRLLAVTIDPGGILHIVGSSAANVINVSQSGNTVTVSGVTGAGTFSAADFTKILVEAGDGNDTVTIDLSTSYPGGSTLLGNSGNDSITGGFRADDIRGGTGTDTIRGGLGNDLLNGESGNDIMDGQGGLDTANYSTRTSAVRADND